MYGDNAKGVNIAFNKNDLIKYALKNNFDFFNITYIDDQKSKNIQEELSNKMISTINEQVKRQNEAYEERKVHLGATNEMLNGFLDIIATASKYKKSCFSSEKESRLIYKASNIYSEYGATIYVEEMKKIKSLYLGEQGKIKLFLPIDLTDFHKSYPFFKVPPSRQEIYIMCGARNNTPKKGYSCRCLSSSIPLRK